MSTDIKVGDLLECVRSDDSELITKGKTYPVVLSEGGILSLRTDIDGMLLVYLENYLEPKASGSLKFKKVETMKEFKAGDLVFELRENNLEIHVLKQRNVRTEWVLQTDTFYYTTDGITYEDSIIPHIFHATPENRQALVTLYGEDAVPELPPSPNEIMIELLKGGSHTAMFADTSHEMARKNGYVALIDSYDENSGYFYSSNHKWKYVIAVDSRGNEITELGGDDE